jgi:hypothetical protein
MSGVDLHSLAPVEGFKRSRTWGALSGFQARKFIFEPAGARILRRTSLGPQWEDDVAHVCIVKKGQDSHRAKRFDCAAVTGIRPVPGDETGTTVEFLLPYHGITLKFPTAALRDTWVDAVIAAGELHASVCAVGLLRENGQAFEASGARAGGGAHTAVRSLFTPAAAGGGALPMATAEGAQLDVVAVAAGGASAAAEEPPLPPGWVKVVDGADVWYEHPTLPSSWERPTPSQPIPSDQLPPGWVEIREVNGDVYYVNHDTGASVWERPS